MAKGKKPYNKKKSTAQKIKSDVELLLEMARILYDNEEILTQSVRDTLKSLSKELDKGKIRE